MLPEERGLGVLGGEKGILHHRDIGGEEDPLQMVAVVEPLGEAQDVKVRVLGGAHDHLGALPGGGKPGRVAVLHQFLPVFPGASGDLPHGCEDGFLGLVRRQDPQSLLGGQLDVDTEPVRQKPQLLHQLRGRAGDGLGVDVAVEAVALPQDAQGPDHQLHGVVRTAEDAGGEEEAFDIVAAVELDGELCQLLRGEHGPASVVGPAVDAVLAVVDAVVGQQDLQQRDAAAIGGEAVTAACDGGAGAADIPLPEAPASAAGSAGGVIFCGIRQDAQLLRDIHQYALRVRRAGCSMASMIRKTWAVRVAMPVSTKRKVVVVIVCDLLSNKCSFWL